MDDWTKTNQGKKYNLGGDNESVIIAIYSESKNPSLRTCGNFSKTGIFSQIFRVPIYARLRIFIQLIATFMKLCHIKRDHPVNIMCAKCPPSAEMHAGIF